MRSTLARGLACFVTFVAGSGCTSDSTDTSDTRADGGRVDTEEVAEDASDGCDEPGVSEPNDTSTDGGGDGTNPSSAPAETSETDGVTAPPADDASGPDDGGETDGALSEVNELTACIAYADASCRRSVECQGLAPDRVEAACRQVAYSCPDVVFSEGSTRTPEGMMACAEEVRAFSCEAWINDERPACVTPGTIPSGEPCAFHSQCSTGWCSGASLGECGECMFEAGPEDDCTLSRFFCPLGTACNEATRRCAAVERAVPPMPSDPPDTSIAAPEEGEPCDPVTGCAADLDCAAGPDGRVCIPYPSVGQSCAEPRTCVRDSYCELDGLVCRELPSLGQACGVDGFTGTAGWCDRGLICDRESESVGTCVELPVVGEPCVTYEDEDGLRGYCVLDADCNLELSPPTCVEEGSGPCLADSECSGGACLCETAECERRTCQSVLDVGASCPQPGAACHPGAACVDGVCHFTESQGTFEALCRR